MVSTEKFEFMVETFYLDGYKLPNYGHKSVIEGAHKLHDEAFYK